MSSLLCFFLGLLLSLLTSFDLLLLSQLDAFRVGLSLLSGHSLSFNLGFLSSKLSPVSLEFGPILLDLLSLSLLLSLFLLSQLLLHSALGLQLGGSLELHPLLPKLEHLALRLNLCLLSCGHLLLELGISLSLLLDESLLFSLSGDSLLLDGSQLGLGSLDLLLSNLGVLLLLHKGLA